jgi:amidase
MGSINELSATEIVKGIKSKKFSAVEVAKAFLDRISDVNPSLNAIIQHSDPKLVLEQARQADIAVSQGKPLGKLHGLPITIKDCLKVEGLICSAGCEKLSHKADTDAPIVSRLKKAGAIVLGLTNVPELLLSAETDNLLYGRTNNPHDEERTCGGSSGGEGAIIAAKGSPLGFGSDAGGSIRIPAHFCGIAAIKPTHGLVPTTGGILGDTPGIFGNVVTYGPLAHTVDDLNLALTVIAGPDGRDFRSPPSSLKNPSSVDLKQLQIGYYIDNGIAKVENITRSAILDAVKAITPFVNSVEEHLPDALKSTIELLWNTIFLGGDEGQSLIDFITFLNIDRPSPFLLEFVEMSKNFKLSVADLRMRLILIDQYNLDMMAYLNRYDAIICPVSATPAKLHGTCSQHIGDFSYTMSYNLCGAPAVVIPWSKTEEGLPIGIQIVSRHWRDDIALAVAGQLENLS